MFDGAKEAKLAAIEFGKSPSGRSGWTLRLSAERVVELGIVDRCSPEAVRRTLQKMS